MSQTDVQYYQKRAETERAAAARAENKHVAEIHEELARQYAALVEHAELRQPLRIVRSAA